MRKIGYARVSTSTQNLDRQIGALRAERCDEVYRERASGKAVKGRPQLEKAILNMAQTGDPCCRGNRVRYRRRTGRARAAPGRPRRQPNLTPLRTSLSQCSNRENALCEMI